MTMETIKCCNCGTDTYRTPDSAPPCHHKRMKCVACKLANDRKSRKAWAVAHPEKERKHRRRVSKRRHERVREETRLLAHSTGFRWTASDEDFVTQNLGVLSYPEIAKKLGRSLSSVEMKIWRMRYETKQ